MRYRYEKPAVYLNRVTNMLIYETNNKGEVNMTKKWYNKALTWIVITITITVGSIVWAFRSKKD